MSSLRSEEQSRGVFSSGRSLRHIHEPNSGRQANDMPSRCDKAPSRDTSHATWSRTWSDHPKSTAVFSQQSEDQSRGVCPSGISQHHINEPISGRQANNLSPISDKAPSQSLAVWPRPHTQKSATERYPGELNRAIMPPDRLKRFAELQETGNSALPTIHPADVYKSSNYTPVDPVDGSTAPKKCRNCGELMPVTRSQRETIMDPASQLSTNIIGIDFIMRRMHICNHA